MSQMMDEATVTRSPTFDSQHPINYFRFEAQAVSVGLFVHVSAAGASILGGWSRCGPCCL